MKTMIEVVMNPVRQRIAQYLILNQTGTVNEIAAELSDVPRPSLYRHIKIMLDAKLLQVVEERAVRGTVEKTYSLVQPKADEYTQEDIAMLIQNALLSVMASFAQYFKDEEVDPVKDMLSVSSSTLLLSDEEYLEMMGKIGQIYQGVITNKPNENRKPRCITIVSSPVNHS